MSDVDSKIEELRAYIDNVNATNIQGLTLTLQAVEAEKEARRQSDIANYKAHTKAGKSRFIEHLHQTMGSDKAVADHLGLSEPYIVRQRRQAKRNGK
ncbi:hypothetical protein WD376_004540 [Vibrio vulnificus]|uniref:hypothetical protein n=1 Tax=Vibrio TaxID=662 RepID=UPI0005F112BB|nr:MULTISPECIES: hypothetical protein [Vibrio]EID7758590.1 hypothetical protein [Vibrio parahaemolyticus]ELP6741451.1 hypothetical protein [Vibrio vulnificus]ELV8644643.1 hypothetical protein [Vibrio vulnificus]ODW12710.1 hypothetical protein BBL79_18705 [Vibrio parahaemolyticus]ODW15741.1 hypothetical protein BBM87_04600 [Vibrio parahaemolyticus]